MPHVELLPSSGTTTAQPGYAFVPDTRPLTSAHPVSGRKRAARASNLGSAGDTTVRQQNAIAKHIAELDKDNHRDIQIPIPKDSSSRGSKGKTTTNVRRILTSQKTFANHLADEEAAFAQKTHPWQQLHGNSLAATKIRRPSQAAAVPLADATAAAADDTHESNPLLRTYMPKIPSAETMTALTSAPPLSYNAARAAPLKPEKPPRQFCEICGYWGSIKCLKCGARVCGLECKTTHDEGRCLKFYA